AYDRLGRAADRDPGGQPAGLGRGIDLLALDRRSDRALPGHRLLALQSGEEVELLGEEAVVVGELEPEQRERLDERTAAQLHLGAAAGDGVEGREALVDP